VAPYDALTIHGGPGLIPSGGMVKGSRVYDASNATLTVGTSGRYFHIMAAAAGGQSASATVAPPVGGTLVAGTTYPTTSLWADSSQTYSSFFGPNSNCGYLHGSLTVHEITQDASSGAITVFAATYSVVCNTTDTALFRGEIRWHSTLGYAGLQTTGVPANGRIVSLDAPTNTNSAPVTFSYSSRGSLPVAVRTPSLVGTGAEAFVITGSTCAGQILGFGESCSVSLLARPLEVGSQEAELVLATDLPGDGIAIPLRVYGSRNIDGLYFPVTPSRILDTRIGLGAPKTAIGAGKTLHLQVGGVGLVAGYPAAGVPAAGVGAVVLNLTATVASADTYLTTYPSLAALPVASSLNLRKGTTVANMVTVRLGDMGSLDIYNGAGSTHVIADVIGYYPDDPSFVAPSGRPASAFHAVPARRILDTRTGSAVPLRYGETRAVSADLGPAVNPGITALAVNITVTAPRLPGYLVAWDAGLQDHSVSTLNFSRGSTVSNMSLVPVSWGATGLPTFKIHNFPGADAYLLSDDSVHVVVDVFGYYEANGQAGGLHFRPTQPVRIVDTRTGQGTTRLGTSAATIATPTAVFGPDTRALITNTTLV